MRPNVILTFRHSCAGCSIEGVVSLGLAVTYDLRYCIISWSRDKNGPIVERSAEVLGLRAEAGRD